MQEIKLSTWAITLITISIEALIHGNNFDNFDKIIKISMVWGYMIILNIPYFLNYGKKLIVIYA